MYIRISFLLLSQQGLPEPLSYSNCLYKGAQTAFTNRESRNNHTMNAPESSRNAYISRFTSALVIEYVCSRFFRNVGNYFKMSHSIISQATTTLSLLSKPQIYIYIYIIYYIIINYNRDLYIYIIYIHILVILKHAIVYQ